MGTSSMSLVVESSPDSSEGGESESSEENETQPFAIGPGAGPEGGDSPSETLWPGSDSGSSGGPQGPGAQPQPGDISQEPAGPGGYTEPAGSGNPGTP